MSQNQIHTLSMTVFADLPMLSNLDLAKNSLTLFDFSMIEKNPQLKRLRIDENIITFVKTSQQFSSNLQTLYLNGNMLTSLPMENLPDISNLQDLRIDQNNLTVFDFESVKDKFTKLENIQFGDNQFECCYVKDKVKTMLTHMPKLSIDESFINYLNDTFMFQRESKCVAVCGRPYQNEKRMDELERIVGKLEKNNQEFFYIKLAFGIGVGIVVIVQLIVGMLCFCCCRKPTNTQSNVVAKDSADIEIPLNDQTESVN
jgi:Leucine rich repeat